MDKTTIATLSCLGVTIICWALGVLFVVLRSNLQKKYALKKQVCINVTNATVVKMNRRKVKKGDTYSYCWFPTYEYYVDGIHYEKESKVGNGKKLFEEGQRVEIYYNPNKPEELYIPAEKGESVVTSFMILAVGFFAAGFLTIGILIMVFY